MQDQISNNKNIFADQQKIALSFLKKCFSDVLKIKPKNVETKLPNISDIINKLKEIKNEDKNIKDEGLEEQKGFFSLFYNFEFLCHVLFSLNLQYFIL